MSLQANDAPAQSPSCDSPPLPASRDSPAASESISTVIDLDSPTKSPRRPRHEAKRPRTYIARPPKHAISEDEKRLTGDYDNPADAVRLPHPSWWLSESQTMLSKPGANKGYKPVDTLNTATRTTNRKPTTYGKHARPRSLIGHSPGPGQTAYSDFQRSKAPTTPSRHAFAQDDEDQWTSGPASVKRRKLEHVIDLIHDDEDDDAVLVVTQTGASTPGTASHERPLSAKSSQSRLSVGSGSTGPDFKPHQPTNEFREVEGLIRTQKKPRQSSSQKISSCQQTSPFGSGSMLDTRKLILQDFQQGEPSHRSNEHEQHEDTAQPVTSKHFPKARINESTTKQPEIIPPITSHSPHSPKFRAQHHLVPRKVDRIEDSDSADELAISPTSTRKKLRSPKAKKAAQSSVKRSGHGKDGSDSWPLSFARSHEWNGTGSTMEDGHATLVLRSDPLGLRVQKYDTEGYRRVMLIHSRQVNKMFVDDTGRIRLNGPRDANGNANIFDLQFLNLSDFVTFCNKYTAALTTNGKAIEREDEYMRKLFDAPLKPRNDKAKSPEVLSSDIQNSKQQETRHEEVETQPGARARRSERRIDETSAHDTKSVATVSARSSRPRLSAPTQILDEDPEICEVPKYSIDTGLGPRWAKALEYGEGRQRAVVHFDDLPRLDEEEYLNDSLIDFYMIYLFRKLKVPAHKVYFFNTYFFTRLTENAGRNSINYKAVERWTSKVDIFSYDYIVVPINDSQTHWYLAIICNVSNIQRKPVIEDFDHPHSHIQEQSEACTTPTVASESEENTKLPLVSHPKSPAGAEQVQNQKEDPNLFDEASISLINRDDTGAEALSNVKADESNPVSLEPETEPIEVPQATADAKTTSQSSISFIKSKKKRKNVPKRDPSQPVVVVLDSLGGIARSGPVRILKDWIAAEGKSKRGMEAVIKENGYYPKSTQIPMQKNWTDCGVYLLGYIEKFFQNPDEFMHKLLTGSMSAAEDWSELNPSDMRHKMRDIIFECHKQQEEARKAQKKAKKELNKAKTSPDPAAKLSTDDSTVPPSVGYVSVEKSPNLETEKQHEQNVAEDAAKIPHRLGSPFEPKKPNAEETKQSQREATAKGNDLPTQTTPSVKPASATSSNTPPRHHSPEVRISTTAAQTHESTGDTHTSVIGSPGQSEPIDQGGSRSPSLNKRRRQDDNGNSESSPNAKRQQNNMSREKTGNGNSRTRSHSPYGREGSAANAPIEIEDSQEVEVMSSQRAHVQSGHVARHGSSLHLSRPTLAIHSSSSIEQLPNLLPKAKIGEHRAREHSEVDDYDRDHDRRSPAPDRSMPSQTSADREQDTQDLVEVISQSTDQMQLDGTEMVDVVRETPEPRRRSPEPT